MGFNRMVKLSAAAAIAVLVVGTAMAQGPGCMAEHGWGMWNDEGSGHDMMGWGSRRDMWRDHGPDWMLNRIEGRLAFIKAELKINCADQG